MLIVAAVLIILIGLVHSYLGEKFILIRLFRQPLPRLFGNDAFTRQTLRFVWHMTTVCWWGFAALLIGLEYGYSSKGEILLIIGTTFGIGALFPLIATRGKHLSWLVFTAISLICYFAAAAA
ncbi:MAG: hypothetical protein OEQ74_08920 [Gammaproteobacteria bacterium]|nr:hypothetical protein [Gammaproteobacteria bacterium]